MAFYRTRPAIDRFMEKVEPVPEAGCWLWVGATKPSGYGNFYMGGRYVNAHRASLLLHGRDAGSQCVCHKCDTPSCVNPDHLFIGAQLENMADMKAKGRASTVRATGEACGQAKLTLPQVREIRASREKTQSLAERFGVTYQAVRAVRIGLTWKAAA